jgi:uncharacterized membrane protein
MRVIADAERPAIATRADRLWLLAILAIALVLRVPGLNAGLWYDEVDTLVHYTRLPIAELLTTYPSLNHHVLFTLEAKISILLFGESAWALRLPALLFGVASVWALWLVAKEITGVWETRLSALLLAVSYHHVWFSQNARGYTGMLFFVLLATYFLLRGARRPTFGIWTAYGVAAALAVYTHLSAAFFIAAQALAYLLTVRTRVDGASPATRLPWAPWYGFALAGALALALHAPLLPQMVAAFSGASRTVSPIDAASVAEWKSMRWMVLEIGRSMGLLGLALPVVAVIVAAGMADFRRTNPVIPATLLVHIPLMLAVLALASMRVWPRYFFIDIGLLCIFLVQGAFFFGRLLARLLAGRRWNVSARSLGIGFAFLGVAASLVLLPRNYAYPKQDLIGARDFVEAQRTADSSVVTLGYAAMPYADYYAPQWREIRTLPDLVALEGARRPIWVVYAFPDVTERRYKEITDHLAARFELAKRFPGTLGGGDVVVFRSAEGR